ncbi:hypothetical protein X566_20065 [Afipia sp. P52-10]|nr:hypothetical protein X566_20065 [Afipia sp. P52-10]
MAFAIIPRRRREGVVVSIQDHPIGIGCAWLTRLRSFRHAALFLLHPTSIDEPFERTLHRGPGAGDLRRHLHLAAHAPAGAIGMAAEQAEHLQVARLKIAVGDRPSRNN